MIHLSDRRHCIELIHEAIAAGAALNKACRMLDVHPKPIDDGLKMASYRKIKGLTRSVQNPATS